jgi:hypothetical protein
VGNPREGEMKLSTGDESTLGNYRKMAMAVFGDGKAVAFLDKKIKESKKGEEEEVIAPESQMVMLLGSIQFK